jgi:tetratricopeptide (TPR) repeat protein
MIKQAVDARPNDGFIVDSLGWAYYQMHRYGDAVDTLERAIELRPEDSTINDHLGDAYWQIGRKREATFQWTHARDMKPEPDQLPLILQKLEHGLKPAGDGTVTKTQAVPASDTPQRQGALPASITVGRGESLRDIAQRIYGNGDLYQLIYDANRDRIRDPDHIVPGMTLSLPAVGAN